MCKYCDIDGYTGEVLPIQIVANSTKQDYEIYILDDCEREQYSLNINNDFVDIRIKVNYCPICGEKLA